MNKRALHHHAHKLRFLNQWLLLVISLLFAGVAVFALRHNNLTALKLRDEVIKVDQQNGDVETALRQLRNYVYGHMNTDLASTTSVYPPIQLKYSYERAVAAEKARVEAANNAIFAEAQAICVQQFPNGSLGSTQCANTYLAAHPEQQAKSIPDASYKFDFASPTWSPDIAGWSVFFAGFFFVLFLIRFVIERWVRFELKNKL